MGEDGERGGAEEDAGEGPEIPPDFDVPFEEFPDEDESGCLKDEIEHAFNDETGTMSEFIKDLGGKVLGLGYNFEDDVLYVRVREKLFREVKLKRQLLSWICQIYDPLGFVCPYVLKGRILMQKLNLQTEIDWNDPVPEDTLKEFTKWKNKVNYLREYKIMRWTSKLGMEDSTSKLLIFCDASKDGYGIVAYLRRELKGSPDQVGILQMGDVFISFMMAKSHVVPLDMLKNWEDSSEDHLGSIPKLELCAAKVAAIWRDNIVRESEEIYEEIILFSDSMTVLGWIRDWRRKFKTFENFRLKRIRLLTFVSEWFYVPTKQNPADICSKGLDANDKKKWKFFHEGPEFISTPQEEWPKEPIANGAEDQQQQRIVKTISSLVKFSPIELIAVKGTKDEPDFEYQRAVTPWPIRITEKISTWTLKVRRVALFVLTIKLCMGSARPKHSETPKCEKEITSSHSYNLRPRPNSKKPQNSDVGGDEGAPNPVVGVEKGRQIPEMETEENSKKIFLDLEKKSGAELLLIRAIQSMYFDQEIKTLLKIGVFEPDSFKEWKHKGSKLISLSPFLNEEDGLMRVGGRLGKSKTLTYDTRHPIILPNSDCEVVQSLIRHYHTKHYHCSIVETYYLLRQKYYFLGGRNTVRKVVSKCLECQLAYKQPTPQKMGELPESRVSLAIPFQHSGMDVFGEFWCSTQGRAHRKRWVLLITCFVTRAIALYPLPDMSLSSVINALIKMNAQFPSLRKLTTDNGPNFKGANREIKEAMAEWNMQEANDILSDHQIEWEFGPAYAGSWGGVWERLVGVTKNSFKACINGRILDTDTFDAILAGVAGMMNRRPLTRQNNNDDGSLVLTPSHFLYPYNHIEKSTSIVPPIPEDGTHLKTTWQGLRESLDLFWKSWSTTYIQTLAERKKWKTSTPPLAVGDMVLLKEEVTPREKWRTCIILEVTNKDPNHPRTFRLRDSSGTIFERHRNSLVHLELY